MFKEAKPIWIESKKKDYNRLCGFLLKFHKSEQSDYELNVAAADCYQCYLNGTIPKKKQKITTTSNNFASS